MRGRNFQPRARLLTLLLLAAALYGCDRSQPTSNTSASKQPPPPPAAQVTPQRTDFEQKLQYVRDGQYTYMYVLARPDDGALDTADIAYLKENTPRETNMWVKTEDGRRAIAGTNFEFTPENLAALRKRFNVEDYSGR